MNDDYNPRQLSIEDATAVVLSLQRHIMEAMSDISQTDSYDDSWNKAQMDIFNELETTLSVLDGKIRRFKHAVKKEIGQ